MILATAESVFHIGFNRYYLERDEINVRGQPLNIDHNRILTAFEQVIDCHGMAFQIHGYRMPGATAQQAEENCLVFRGTQGEQRKPQLR